MFSTRFPSIASPLSTYSYHSFTRNRFDIENPQGETRHESVPCAQRMDSGAIHMVQDDDGHSEVSFASAYRYALVSPGVLKQY